MKFAELIPQIFYDAIARVATGLILLASIVDIWSADLTPLLESFDNGFKSAPTTISMATLVVAYVLAIGIEGIGLKKTRKFVARLMIMRQQTARERRKTQWAEAWKDFSKSPSGKFMKDSNTG